MVLVLYIEIVQSLYTRLYNLRKAGSSPHSKLLNNKRAEIGNYTIKYRVVSAAAKFDRYLVYL